MPLPASHPASLPEPALLARADWRFLLPAPPEGGFRHLLLLGGPAGLAELLLATGFARRVSRSLPKAGAGRAGAAPADVAAVLVGSRPDAAAEAARCLAPGGVLYCEMRGGFRPALPAGLGATGLWAVWPGLAGDAARAWVPLDPPGALPWFVDTLYPASTPRKRAVAAALDAMPDPRRAARLMTRSFALTAVAGPRRGAPAALLGHPDLPAAVRRGEPSPLLLSRGRERVALLPFPAAGRSPSAVLKVPRLPRWNGVGEEEQETLRRVLAGLPASVAAALPRPVGLLRAGGLAVAVESYAPGRSLLASTGAWAAPARRRIADLELTASWLAGFHRTAELARAPWSGRHTGEWVFPHLDAFRRLGATPAEERLFGLTLERAAALAGTPVPTVWQHRDFTPWNLLREAESLAVIDWEGARPGPPLADLLHFATLWHQAAEGVFDGAERLPERLAAFRELFGLEEGDRPAGRYAAAARRAVAGYCRELGLDERLLPVLLVATWAELAARRAGAGSESPEAFREAVSPVGAVHAATPPESTPEAAYVAVLADSAARLFGGGDLS